MQLQIHIQSLTVVLNRKIYINCKMSLVTLVIFTSFETQFRINMFREACDLWPCYILTNKHINTNISHIRQIVIKSPCNESMYSAYMVGNMRYLVGYAIMQKYMWNDWILLVDDDTRVFPDREDFLHNSNPKQMILMGDFGNQGHSRFACGGGGFLFSKSAFLNIDFNRCVITEPCISSLNWMVDHILTKCLLNYPNLTIDASYNCGTCSNVWSPKYTNKRLLSGICKFMHNQRSHSPQQYKLQVYRHRPLTVHRWYEFFS